MKNVSKILSYLMLLILLTAETCGDSNVQITREERLSDVFRDIEDEFVNEELPSDALAAFEKRAVQKINDLADYINIYGDSTITREFRMQVRNMITETFYSETDVQKYFRNFALQEDSINYRLSYKGNTGVLKTDVDSITIIRHFQKETNLSYFGEIQFSQKLFKITVLDTGLIKNYNPRMKIVALKTSKQFGEKSENVWEVYLGEIK